ncbi:2-oxo-4-hydroxy-4-carboxy-5-ureidoimidazoline decarboxylase [Streptomyces sp. NRRL F-5126]|uniref:2-oxo-4-hydroxy-4-carboxy-5-ureidoimidazoline decarboxylase n=1 Tax=Streptomyces sp. NRRL F-5126 TaxID=1463857 RepID=UPI000A57D0B2
MARPGFPRRTHAVPHPFTHARYPRRPTPFPAASEEPPLSREESGLRRFNTAPADIVHDTLLTCCGSDRWARRVAAHRPYPDLAALLAAADEAGYDLSPADVTQALAAESAAARCVQLPGSDVPAAARTALRAAFAAYEASFGHTFVISLAGRAPDEYLDQVLAAIRTRLGNDPEDERAVAADELRRLARSRLAALVAGPPVTGAPGAGATGTRPAGAPEMPRPRGSVPSPVARTWQFDCGLDHTGDPRANGPASRR